MDKNWHPLRNLRPTDIFETVDGDKFMRIENPNVPALGYSGDYEIWVIDIGNGHIKKDLSQNEHVKILGRLWNMVSPLIKK